MKCSTCFSDLQYEMNIGNDPIYSAGFMNQQAHLDSSEGSSVCTKQFNQNTHTSVFKNTKLDYHTRSLKILNLIIF